MPAPWTILTPFDGGKFATRYGLVAGFTNPDFYFIGNQLFLRAGVTIPDDPPIIDPPDSQTTVLRNLAVAETNSSGFLAKFIRAVAAVMVDEINFLRDDVIGTASQVWNPASMTNATGLTSPSFTVTGAAFGDIVHPIAPYTLAGVTATAYVSAANTVVIRLHNGTGGAVDLASGTWSVMVLRHAVLAPRTLAQAKTAIQNQITAGLVD